MGRSSAITYLHPELEEGQLSGFDVGAFMRSVAKNSLIHGPRLYKEAKAVPELINLLTSDLYGGNGIPRGDSSIMVIPGAGGGDYYLSVLRGWLSMLGHNPYASGINCNIFYIEPTLDKLERRLKDMNERRNSKSVIIGHSLGAMLGKLLSDRFPEEVESVIGLAGVLNAKELGTNPLIAAGALPAGIINAIRYGTDVYNKELKPFHELDDPAKVPIASVYSRRDGILSYKACLRPDSDNYECRSSHVGIAWNTDSYKILANLLHKDTPPKLRLV